MCLCRFAGGLLKTDYIGKGVFVLLEAASRPPFCVLTAHSIQWNIKHISHQVPDRDGTRQFTLFPDLD